MAVLHKKTFPCGYHFPVGNNTSVAMCEEHKHVYFAAGACSQTGGVLLGAIIVKQTGVRSSYMVGVDGATYMEVISAQES